MHSSRLFSSLRSLGLATASSFVLMACGGGGDSAPDTTAPLLTGAVTDSTGNQIILTYDESLSTTTAPAGSFSVSANGNALGVAGVATNGKTAVLTLSSGAIGSGQTVLVTYTAPSVVAGSANLAIQDATGNDAMGFSAHAVTNLVGVVSPSPSGPDASATLAVTINGASATPGSNGEYLAHTNAHVAIAKSSGGLSSVSTTTVDANNNAAVSSMGVNALNSTLYDVTFTNPPSGGLTTINFTALGVSVKIRWQ